MNYFTLFDLPVDYSVDIDLLVARWQALQQQFHPDRYVLRPESERLVALQQAATINDAYQTLKNPLKRAQYLLSLQGITVGDERYSMRDTAFLMEQMALREEFDAIVHQADSKMALTDFTARVAMITQKYNLELSQHYIDKHWPQMADTVCKLHFLHKLLQQIEERMDELPVDFS